MSRLPCSAGIQGWWRNVRAGQQQLHRTPDGDMDLVRGDRVVVRVAHLPPELPTGDLDAQQVRAASAEGIGQTEACWMSSAEQQGWAGRRRPPG